MVTNARRLDIPEALLPLYEREVADIQKSEAKERKRRIRLGLPSDFPAYGRSWAHQEAFKRRHRHHEATAAHLAACDAEEAKSRIVITTQTTKSGE